MRFVFFTHSLVSDWNHGNAHFLRGVMRELQERGHEAVAWEPARGWSRQNLVRDHGEQAVARFHARFPHLRSRSYDPDAFDPDAMLDGAHVVVVHEWTEPAVVAAIGAHRLAGGRNSLLFHDTHHRAAAAAHEMARLDLAGYDGVLCFGEVIRELYLRRGWARRAWTWHEAADTALFRPMPESRLPEIERGGDLVWVGNWGDGERSAELRAFLLEPIAGLRISALIHGVRYPDDALAELGMAGARYGGWLPNDRVPEVFAHHRVTVHVPRRPYVEALPGIPTIRVFEALACGIPLVCAPWRDAEGLFRPGQDYLVARTGEEMTRMLGRVLADADLARSLIESGLATVRARHTCAHRVEELLAICNELKGGERADAA